MARPRYEAGDASARDRIIDAFWKALAETPFSKLSALGIARAAGVNKNTFYYHFADIDALAEQAIDGLLFPELLEYALSRSGDPGAATKLPRMDAVRARRVKAILSENGTALHVLLADRAATLWRERLATEGITMDADKEALLAFASGGLVSALRSMREEALPQMLARIGRTGLLPGIIDRLCEPN